MTSPVHNNTKDIVAHINKCTNQIVTRFIALTSLFDISPLLSQPNADDEDDNEDAENAPRGVDRTQAAVNAVKIEVEREGLIRAVQDLLTLSRHMKELWVFGELDTLGERDEVAEERLRTTEKNAMAVLEGLKGIMGGTEGLRVAGAEEA